MEFAAFMSAVGRFLGSFSSRSILSCGILAAHDLYNLAKIYKIPHTIIQDLALDLAHDISATNTQTVRTTFDLERYQYTQFCAIRIQWHSKLTC
jgi:hypothetical protein